MNSKHRKTIENDAFNILKYLKVISGPEKSRISESATVNVTVLYDYSSDSLIFFSNDISNHRSLKRAIFYRFPPKELRNALDFIADTPPEDPIPIYSFI